MIDSLAFKKIYTSSFLQEENDLNNVSSPLEKESRFRQYIIH